MIKGTNKLRDSIYYKFALDCIQQGLNPNQIHKELAKKGMKVSLPTIRDFYKDVRKQGINVEQMNSQLDTTAMQLNNKLKSMPKLSTIFNRRNFLVETLLSRRQKLIDFADEGPRTEKLMEMFYALEKFIKNKEESKILPTIETIKHFIKVNFKSTKPDATIENLIRFYTMDIHDICKYIEQWTSRYEINELLEKMCKEITKCAINAFGNYLKNEKEETREKVINNFVNNVDLILKDIKEYELKLGEKYEIK